MRHIPEEELHAYLDQGLSRTQCVEIESHLADCASCRALRDGIAALRDRTTALLARLAPPRKALPTFESLRRRAAEEASIRRRRLQRLAWAASLVAAVGLGWGASAVLGPASIARMETASPRPRMAAVAQPAAAVRQPSEPAPPPPDTRTVRDAGRQDRPAPRIARAVPARPRPDRSATLAVLDVSPAPELTKLDPPRSSTEEFGGIWRTLSWDGAEAETGKPLPRIEGLPVVQVQIQAGEQGTRPVTVVAQQLASGQVIRTIEGSATDVSHLLAVRAAGDSESLTLRTDSILGGGRPTDQAMAMQVGDRMLAITGALPPDSLRAMIRRLNAEMRTK
ncbi:MAG: anti-sigma factor family protein [Gemmatimonadales bacterium]